MTAEEARQFTRCGEQIEFDEVMQVIDTACRGGEYNVIWGGRMELSDRRWLMEYGYALHKQDSGDKEWWVISWEKE
jgi:hypothetical protein